MTVLNDVSFCHLVVGVTDMDLLSLGPAAGCAPDQAPFEIGGVRMFFVKDPDGLVEFIELPGGVRSTYEMHRGVRLHMGPVE